jgi:hypothetical protein
MKMQHPFTALISGPTGSGKTQFTLKLIKQSDKLVTPPPQEIVWCYGVYQDAFTELTNVRFIEGLPDINEFDGSKRILLVIDDLMHEANEKVAQIFTKGSHHKNISILFLTQNIFHSSKHNRTMNLNSHYIVLFKNPRDIGQVSILGRQMFPKPKFFEEAFKDATARPYGYLFVDLKPNTDEQLRVRTNIFEDEAPQFVYVPK